MDDWKPKLESIRKSAAPPLPDRRDMPTQKQKERIEAMFTVFATEHLKNYRGLHLNAAHHEDLQTGLSAYITGDTPKYVLDTKFSNSFLDVPMPIRQEARSRIIGLRKCVDAFDKWRSNPVAENSGLLAASLYTLNNHLDAEGIGIDPKSSQGKALHSLLGDLLSSIPPEHKAPPQTKGPRIVKDFNER